MTKVWTVTEEATRLAKRFEGVGQADFARTHKVPGGPSMLSQHIKGRRPMNLEAAMAYARGFGVTLAEISPRLAKAVLDGASLTGEVGKRATPERPAAKSIDDTVRELLADERLAKALAARLIDGARQAFSSAATDVARRIDRYPEEHREGLAIAARRGMERYVKANKLTVPRTAREPSQEPLPQR